MGQTAPEKLLELAVNAVTMYEGKESGARQIKIDFTTAEKTAEKLRKVSGGEGIMFITCGYDEERRREDRKNERWIPMAKQADGSEPTRQQVLEEARKLTENNGIQLMHDGITFKIRVPSGKEEEGWRQMLSKPPPPSVNFVADGLPGSIPNQVIEQVMKETLDWDVKVARVIVRNKGKEATKRAFLKCTGRPAADTIEVGGKMVVLRAQADKEKDVEQQQEGFFAGLKKEEAARAVLKEKEPTQSMKDFAFRALSVEKQGPVWNSLQEDDEDMDENSEAGSGSFKECKETPLQIALSKSLEQKLKTELATERARHAEEMRETRQRLEEAQREILERRNMEAESQMQVVQTQAIKSVEDVNMMMGRQLLDEMMSKQREAMEQMKAWFVQAQQECLQQLTEARDEKTRKTTASVTP